MDAKRAAAARAEFANKIPLAGNAPCITCVSPGEGAGSMAMRYVSVMTASCVYQRTYIHTPFRNVGHRPRGYDPQAWDREWETFFNLGLDEIQDQPAKAYRWCYREVTGREMGLIDWIFRDKYHDNPKPPASWFSPDEWNVAIHVRRGDALEARHQARVTRNPDVERFLRGILPKCTNPENKPVRIHLMSEGSRTDFDLAERLEVPCELHLDECPFMTFHHLVMADTLITAKSTFSYFAGILNPGQVFYEPFWHEPLPRWIELEVGS
ncbi:hypothetical protein [Luteolibacter sp. Populi]|uniref:hypothetical protein n=1 Tax=Luteolibacter sp. Populi TaxID=3230487 RepID=UPI0034679B25